MIKSVCVTAILIYSTVTVAGDMLLRVKGIKSFSSNKSLSSDWEYYVKSYKQMLQTFNGHFNFTRPIYDAKVKQLRIL